MTLNDNDVLCDPRLSPREFARECALRAKANGPLASLPDVGVQLTATEEAELRAYAEGLGVNFDEVVDYYSQRFHILPPRKLGPITSHLADKGYLPVNHLAFVLKVHIYERHWDQKYETR